MRGKRSKQYRKLMQQYALAFGFREPHQVLVDAGIIKDAARFKMRLGAMLERTLHGPIKPMITQCCIRHLYSAASDSEKDNWIEVAKQAERRRCGHHELEQPLSALECLMDVVDPKGSGTNRHRYVVASQEQEVRRAMREIAGVPLVYIARSVMILEPMAARTEQIRDSGEKEKVRAGLKGRRGIAGVKRKRDQEHDAVEGDLGQDEKDHTTPTDAPIPKKRTRGPKGPNPLSMRKGKTDKKTTSGVGTAPAKDGTARSGSGTGIIATGQAVDTRPGAHDTTVDSIEGLKKRKRKRKPNESNDQAEL